MHTCCQTLSLLLHLFWRFDKDLDHLQRHHYQEVGAGPVDIMKENYFNTFPVKNNNTI